MKRGRVLDISDSCVHVTHRCHDRQFLFRFVVDRRNCARRLRDTAKRFDVSVLDYIVTGNPVHLLLKADRAECISAAMQYLQGLRGRDFNRRKQRSGAYWSDRFSPTLIENGCHLWSEATAVGSPAWVESLAEHVVIGPRSIEAVHPSPSRVGEEEASYALRLSARQFDLLWHP